MRSTPSGVCLALLSCLWLPIAAPAAAQDVLIFDSSSSASTGGGALLATALGLDPPIASAQTSTAASFLPTLEQGGWEILVVDTTGGAPDGDWQTALEAAIAGGTCVVATLGAEADAQLLGPSFEADIVGSHGPLDVARWNAHPLFVSPLTVPDTLVVVQDTPPGSGFRLDPLGTAVAAAGFTPAPVADEAAIVIGNEGRTILNGFLFDELSPLDFDMDTRDDALELGINEVLFVNTPDCSTIAGPVVIAVPTLGEWGLAATLLGTGLAGLVRLRRRRP